jgi:predicted XRE-type DNA-binding protein
METLNRLIRKTTAHWTQQSIADFVYRISSDFVIQIEKKLEKERIRHNEFATQLGVTRGRVSQLMNNPGNLTLRNVVHCARTLGMKVAIVAYEDGDTENRSGPINSEIFSTCWQRAGAPRDFFELSGSLGRIYHVVGYPADITAENRIWDSRRLALSNDTAATHAVERVN